MSAKDPELAQLNKVEDSILQESTSTRSSKLVLFVGLFLLVAIVGSIIGIVLGTLNNNDEEDNIIVTSTSPTTPNLTLNPSPLPTNNPTIEVTSKPTFLPTVRPGPTTEPTASPTPIFLSPVEFFRLCDVADLFANPNDDYFQFENSEVFFGVYSCFDDVILACDADFNKAIYEGDSCSSINPDFTCQCEEGKLFAFTDDFYNGRSELGCGKSPEDVACVAANTSFGSGEFLPVVEFLLDFVPVDIAANEVFDEFVSICKTGLDFTACLNPLLNFACEDKSFTIEACDFQEDSVNFCDGEVGVIDPESPSICNNVFNTSFPTESPANFQQDFRPLEFFQMCDMLDILTFTNLEASNFNYLPYYIDFYYGNLAGVDLGNGETLFGIYTCIDDTIVVCDADFGRNVIEGEFCPMIDPDFKCQCGEGEIFALTDGFYVGNTELACGINNETTQCTEADDFINNFQRKLFNLFLNFNYKESEVYDLQNFYDVDELRDLLPFEPVDEGIFFDFLSSCKSGLQFTSCVNSDLKFECNSGKFEIEVCDTASTGFRFCDGATGRCT